ncbi:hypothetical protein MVEN_00931600 [Mycena venus]|uniref:Cytochrome P450 n=1 Tax=Mycena venus TaxID=2733690 RepID=A0A8H7D1J7_9AGAR|nr:hypothetical protein MVEN_00931600 [Mycena venus]
MSLSGASATTPLTVALAGIVATIAISSFKRWTRTRKPYAFIPGPDPDSVAGYLLDLHNPDGLDWHYSMPEKYGHIARLKGGLFMADALYITDPAALNSILIKQQNWFPESTEFAGRVSKLTPLFYEVTRQLQSKLTAAVAGKPPGQVVEMLDYLTRTTLEIVGTAGIGHTFNSFDDKSKTFEEFHGAITTTIGRQAVPISTIPRVVEENETPCGCGEPLHPSLHFSGRRWPRAAIYVMRPVYLMLYKARQKVLEEGGSAALAETPAGGKDLMSSMIQANWDADEADKMPDDVVLANMGSIVHGGQETTSSSLARFLTIVAEDSDLQQKLRAELQEAKAKKAPGEDLDYVEIERLPLLDAVVREMLRVYAPVTFVWRQTTKDVLVPLTYPIRSATTGEEIKELLIEQGTAVYLGLGAANRSTAIWGPDAAEFKPERWLNRTQLEAKLPGAYSGMMTFLSGAKVCPGRIFAILEMKLILSVLLLAFSFDPISEPIDWQMGIAIEPRVHGREKEGIQVPVCVTTLSV